ncbi:MAG: sulfotransferase [Bacteroidales bacterium]|nr:sulfotransferase [Bacteroidales bacterium]
MIYYLIVFITVSLLSVGIILLKKPFFSFAYATSRLLNSMLESNQDEKAKQKGLLHSLGIILIKFGILVLFIAVVVGVSLIPMLLYVKFKAATMKDLDMTSFYFYFSMILGSFLLFVFPRNSKKKNEDYSDWSKLLHRMILDNYNISRSLFGLEKTLFKKKAKKQYKDFVIVSGLARGGTTALTNLLHETGQFHSLSYDNMPFLLSVNIWRKIYHPKKSKLRERAHGDNILFGYDTIEALEEYFFKVFLKDKFIQTSTLTEHEIDETTYNSYLTYQNLISKSNTDTTYLAKNNNLILRYKSLREYNPGFKIILIFRSPVTHAYSLLNQHRRFSIMQKENSFALEYMNWLGHHEFGLNHKVFDLKSMDLRKRYEDTSINYWIAVWISYYTHILSMVGDKSLLLIDYADLCSSPGDLLHILGNILDLDLAVNQKDPYPERDLPNVEIDSELFGKSDILYHELQKHKIQIKTATSGKTDRMKTTIS